MLGTCYAVDPRDYYAGVSHHGASQFEAQHDELEVAARYNQFRQIHGAKVRDIEDMAQPLACKLLRALVDRNLAYQRA